MVWVKKLVWSGNWFLQWPFIVFGLEEINVFGDTDSSHLDLAFSVLTKVVEIIRAHFYLSTGEATHKTSMKVS